ncbi:ATP-binding cassette domain-containing protein [Mammaliicoccus stepanovicii]|uniref:ATP-binding cassette domain-containing protein n=1 Tax=Mammaliicoccus stepanovicii TaxID=643214 RepID=UPI001664AD9B|nr:ATP-binding cassette domain-containing protein [Mammaliicoccus stepanovicii]
MNFTYKKSNKETLTNVSFSLKEDRLNILIGMNGSGKSTLLDCITNNFKAESDEIRMPSTKEISYLTQNNYYTPKNLGKDFIKLFLGMITKNEKRLFEQNFYDNLTDLEKEKYNHLLEMELGKMSFGERKWLLIVMFSHLNRKLYIFDEPTSGVDPLSRKMILEKLQHILSKNGICLIATHQLQDLVHLNPHIIFLNKGKVVFEGLYEDWLSSHDTSNPDIAFEQTIINI